MKKLTRPEWTLALCIALFPPIWAVLSSHVGVQTGAVALICAGVYTAANGDKKRAVPISLGFLAGDIWAIFPLWIAKKLSWNPDLELFCTLFVMGGVAVLIASAFPKVFYLPAWLSGWAIGLTIMSPLGFDSIGSYPVQIGISMLVGVWYVGVFLDALHRFLNNRNRPERTVSADEE
ncbi:MAG: DUF1097 domain-containing protein [Clostridia bacterium]|nr:DUF1097 domain-containing protein [Clostridia bacterium]